MLKYENDCVNCDVHGCVECNRSSVPRRYCDRCGETADGGNLDGEDFCDECLDKELEELVTAQYTWREIYNKMFPENDLNVLWL